MTVLTSRKTGIITFILLYIAFGISYIDRAAISIALSQIGKDFNLGAADLGIIISVFFFGYALMQIPGGWLADRYGSKWIVIGTIVMWSVFTMTTSYAWSFVSLLAIRFVFGLAEGGFPSASIKAIGEMFDKESRPKLASLLVSSNYAGSIFAPLIMAPLMIALGWRHAFEAIGGAGILFGLVYFFVVPHVRGNAPEPATTKTVVKKPILPAHLLKSGFLWKMTIVWFGLSCVNKGLDSWMPLYLLQERGLDLKAVAYLTPIPFAAATIATAIGGLVMSTLFRGRETYMLVLGALLTAIALYFMAKSSTTTMLITFQSIVYFFKSFVFAGVIALPTKVLNQNDLGSGIGIINFGGQSAGFIAPAVIGFIVAGTGSFETAFLSLVATCVIAAIVAMFINPVSLSEPAGARA